MEEKKYVEVLRIEKEPLSIGFSVKINMEFLKGFITGMQLQAQAPEAIRRLQSLYLFIVEKGLEDEFEKWVKERR